jgi:HAMP domain-containing protein
MLLSFGLAFTIVFALIWVWVFRFTTEKEMSARQAEVQYAATTIAERIGMQNFQNLTKELDARPAGHPWSKDEIEGTAVWYVQYLSLNSFVASESNTPGSFSYYRGKDGKLRYAISVGYQPSGLTDVQPGSLVEGTVSQGTYDAMSQSLEGTTPVYQPPYQDTYGSWISAYAPIHEMLEGDQRAIGGVAVDFPLDYVQQTVDELRSKLIPIMLVSYVVLLLLVLAASTWLTRPLVRLRDAAGRVAAGEYDLGESITTSRRIPDEMTALAESFRVMAAKVAARERSLTQEVRRLRIEIDQGRREAAVTEITESDYFSDLEAKAEQMRHQVSQGRRPHGPGPVSPP